MFGGCFRVVVVLIAISTRTVLAQSEPRAVSYDEVQEILQRRVDIEKQCVGIIVGLIQPDSKQVIGYGRLRRGDDTTPDSDTVFEIGSVTKVFTTLLLADMVIRGEVALDDSASKYLPQRVSMPSKGDRKVTLVDLATHTSALPPMPDNFKPADAFNPFADYTESQMYAALSDCTLTRMPGKKYEYSNLGMGLLGHILALRASSDYQTLVAERITGPLGMNDTAITLTVSMEGRLATGHNDMLEAVKNFDFPTLAGAGALRSTVGDMMKFLEVSMGQTDSPLSKAIDIQTKTRYPTGSPNLSIALAWHKLALNGSELCFHNGQTGGYHSFVGFDKKRSVGVIVLANTATDIDDIGLHILDRQIPLRKIEAKKVRIAIKVDPKSLARLVGDYELVPGFVISITRKNDQLMLQATGQPSFELYAESDSEFFLKAVDAQISFVKEGSGKITGLILHQNGTHQPATRRNRFP